MAKKKKSIAVPVSESSSESKSVSVRKIKNGFLVEKSGNTKDGWEREETFYEKKPEVRVEVSSRAERLAAGMKGGK